MIKSKKQSLIVIGVFTLVLMLGTVTYAFFNYTRTGTANVIKTGRISFSTNQTDTINLTNVFPIDKTTIGTDTTNTDEVVISITGDTTYSEGIEYLVTATDVNNTIGSGNNQKTVPISISVTASNLGTEDEEYFDNRENANSHLYRILSNNVVEENGRIAVGYIKSGATGINGTLTIKAYLDKDKIAISDTYPEGDVTHTEGEEPNQEEIIDYTNGTTSTWINGRTVLTTTEWNTLQTNGVSFKVKVESNESIWVEEIRTINAMTKFPKDVFGAYYNTSSNIAPNIKEVYFNKMGITRMQTAYDAAAIKADLTYNNEGTVLAWLEENSNDSSKYNLIIASDGDTYFPENSSYLFAFFYGIEKIEFNNINTSRVTNIDCMFMQSGNMTSLDLSMFDTRNIVSYTTIVSGDMYLNNLNLDNWIINSSASFSGTLTSTESLKNLSCKNWVLPSTFDNIFYRKFSNSSIETIDVTGWDLTNTTNISGLFGKNFLDPPLKEIIGLETWDTSNITNMSELFDGCNGLNRIYVSSLWNLSNVTNSSNMFRGMTSLAGQAPNATYAFDSDDAIDKTYARIATDDTKGYLTDISLKPNN